MPVFVSLLLTSNNDLSIGVQLNLYLHGKKYFFNCCLAAPRPTLGHCRGGSLTDPMLITAFDS